MNTAAGTATQGQTALHRSLDTETETAKGTSAAQISDSNAAVEEAESYLHDHIGQLREAPRERLSSDIRNFHANADYFLRSQSPEAQIRFIHTHLAGSLPSETSNDERPNSLHNMQLTLGCPAARNLRSWPEIEYLHNELHKEKKWPTLGAAVGLYTSGQKIDHVKLVNGEITEPHKAYSVLEATYGLYGNRDKQTQLAAQKFLEVWSNAVESQDELTSEQFKLIFCTLTARGNKNQNIHNLSHTELNLALDAFCVWRDMPRSSRTSDSTLEALKNAAEFLKSQPNMPATAKERLNGQWDQYLEYALDHKLSYDNYDINLRLCFSELLGLLEDDAGKVLQELTQLRYAENGICSRLTELREGDAQAKMWARKWLTDTYKLLTGRKKFEPQAKNYADDFLHSKKSVKEKVAISSTPSNLPAHSEDYIAKRVSNFRDDSQHIIGQESAKEEIILHFADLLRGRAHLPPGLFGPPRVGKSELLRIAYSTFFDDVQVYTVNCRASGPTLQGGEQKYVGAQPGDIARKIMEAPEDDRYNNSGKIIPARKHVIIIFDDIDHTTAKTQALAASAIANESVTDAYFNFELDLRKALFGLCGNDPDLSAHLCGRFCFIEIFAPQHERMKEIVAKTVDKHGRNISLSHRVIDKLASDTMCSAPRREVGVSGLQDETKRLLRWGRNKVPHPELKWRLGTADAIDRVATQRPHVDKDLRANWWQDTCAKKLRNLNLEAYRQAHDENVSRARVLFRLLFGEKFVKNDIYVATEGSSGNVFFDETQPQTLFEVFRVNKGGSLHYFTEDDLTLPSGLRAINNASPEVLPDKFFEKAKEQLESCKKLLLLWGQPRWLPFDQESTEINSEYLIALAVNDENLETVRQTAGVIEMGAFLESIKLPTYHSISEELFKLPDNDLEKQGA